MQLDGLATEGRNRNTLLLDSMTSLELVTVMNREDALVPLAVSKVLPQIAEAVDTIARCLGKGGRLIYVGCGTSGRIGAQDASECPPTFSMNPEMVQFVMAGGESALVRATEASEDSTELGERDMRAKSPGPLDAVVGLAASGRTPYTIAAIVAARKSGAATVGVSCNIGSGLGAAAALKIELDVGAEVLAGSTRLKAGTAQKLICNMLTTGAMAQLGYVYSNLMVNLHLKNEKLLARGLSILETVLSVSREQAERLLQNAEMSVPVALVMGKADVDKAEARERLRQSNGHVRRALALSPSVTEG